MLDPGTHMANQKEAERHIRPYYFETAGYLRVDTCLWQGLAVKASFQPRIGDCLIRRIKSMTA
jgi:hypothetical protein